MDRSKALRILGLGSWPSPDPETIEGAYWRVRAHLERRAEADPELRAQCRAELAELEAALQLAILPPEARDAQPTAATERVRAPRWLIGWAGVATLAALVLALLLWSAPSRGPGGGSGAGAGADEGGGQVASAAGAPGAAAPVGAAPESAPPVGEDGTGGVARAALGGSGGGPQPSGPPLDPAILVATAKLDDSQLQIVRSADGAGLYSGAVDDTEHSLAPGRYVLRVSNTSCPDVWESEVLLEPGERREVEAQICENKGFLVVRSNVSGDRVSIDARPVGGSGTRKHPVSAGEHRILVQKEGYVPWEGVTKVKPTEVITLRAQLFEASDADTESSRFDADLADRGWDERHDRWHAATERWMLSRYDFDRSGLLDTPEEVNAVECRDLLDVEGSFDRNKLGVPLTRFFGFDGSEWKEGALGFDGSVREVAYQRMRECGVR